MTAPEKITIKTDILHEQGGAVNLEYLVTPREIFNGEYTRSDLYEAAQARIKELEEAAKGQCIIVNQAGERIKKLEDKLERIKAAWQPIAEHMKNSERDCHLNIFTNVISEIIDQKQMKAQSQAIESEA